VVQVSNKARNFPVLRITLATFFLVCASLAQAATVTLDQSSPIEGVSGGPVLTDDQNFAQTFTSGIAGNLVQLDIALAATAQAMSGFTVSIYGESGSGPETGAPALFSQFYDASYVSVLPDEAFTSFDVASAGIVVGVGDQLSIVVSRDVSFQDAFVNNDIIVWSSGENYSAGNAYKGASATGPWTAVEGDQAFQTHVSAVPVPAAAWLFGSALAGLGWLRRKSVV
jgi:hypothetical protein